MTSVSFANKRNFRLWSIIFFLNVAFFIVWWNFQSISHQNISKSKKFGLAESNNTDPLINLDQLVIRLQEVSFRTRELKQLLKCRNRSLRFQRIQHGEYWLLKNLVIGRKSLHIGCAETLTYTTIGDYTFFDNLRAVASRWRAPISFAIHTPGYDLNTTLDAIQYVRNCLLDSETIKDWVTFHVYFPHQHMPYYVPYNEHEVLNRPFICTFANGSQVPPPYKLISRNDSYKVRANLTFPINVGRNIARQAANTHFIFPCDIELYPSLGFVNQFLDMVASNHSVLALEPGQPKRVYPLAVFEIENGVEVPEGKDELIALYRNHLAQIFHVDLCASCHKIPAQEDWLNRPHHLRERLNVFTKSLREKRFRSWEPFYVSDNSEPLFDERVTWEGQSNKRIQIFFIHFDYFCHFQNYAMCLLGYEYHVLHPAFLVHSPGIKISNNVPSSRQIYAKEMTKFINTKIEPEYRVLFGQNAACRT
ncbi:hypothetical protein KR009_006984 [Drosophila setifemur]|nr:hypothetical protein KR009_006984 [Drosophila setifemur]